MKQQWHEFKGLVLRYFPERQLFLRSNNRVRYLTIPTQVQIVGATGLAITFIWLSIATLQVILQSNDLEQREQVIKSINADYLSLSNDFTSLEKELERRAALIEKRQKLIDTLVTDLAPEKAAEDEPQQQTGEDDTRGISEAQLETNYGDQVASLDDSSSRRKALLDRMMALVERQNAQAETLALVFASRSDAVSAVTEKTKVPLADVYNIGNGPVGGPFLPETDIPAVFSNEDDDPLRLMQQYFHEYQAAMAVLDSYPMAAPSKKYYISDYFGPRRDPIRGIMARHAGLDIAAWKGTPVLSTAQGRVVFSGWNGVYGNMVDIDHGNGFKTRYGHMNKLHVAKGVQVEEGHHIGDVGDTGRTTGAHIHYEVWFNGRLVNPLPFLKVESDVREIKNRFETGATSDGN